MTVRRPMTRPGFARLWTATTVSYFGTYVTMVALQVLMVTDLHASAGQIGLVNAARWLPYRHRRRTVLIGSDLGRAVLLGVIPVLGLLALLNDAAYQSYLPRLVPPAVLNPANARLEQSSHVAQTTGPLVGGVLADRIGYRPALWLGIGGFAVTAARLAG